MRGIGAVDVVTGLVFLVLLYLLARPACTSGKCLDAFCAGINKLVDRAID